MFTFGCKPKNVKKPLITRFAAITGFTAVVCVSTKTMEARGVEPLSENPSPRISTSVACYFGTVSELSQFPPNAANKHAAEVGRLSYINGLQPSSADVHH